MNEQWVAKLVLIAFASGKQMRGRPRIGCINDVTVAWVAEGC